MSQFTFGSGSLYAQRTDVANSTPMGFGILQNVSMEFAGNTKPLFGQFQLPVAVARGTIKVSAKAQFARINGRLFNDLFFGVSTVVGRYNTAIEELQTIAAGAATVTNSATFGEDLGVVYTLTGKMLVKVASAPAVGQYSGPAAGVYTFNVGDNGLGVKISYTYNPAGGVLPQQKVTISNPLLGVQPIFQSWFYATFNNQPLTLRFLACVASKLSFGTKLEDWMIPEFDFECFTDASNNLMTYGTDE